MTKQTALSVTGLFYIPNSCKPWDGYLAGTADSALNARQKSKHHDPV